MKKMHLAYFFLFSSLVALSFLIYTLLHLKQLEIEWTHPRVWVEAVLFIAFLILGIWCYRGG